MSKHGSDLSALLDRLGADDQAYLRAWLGGATPDVHDLDIRPLIRGSERLAEVPSRPRHDDPQSVRSVGIIGGGTAGYLTALALRASRPWLSVTLVESSKIPIIGVGEATTPLMVTFLHHVLGIDPDELYRRVRPTWKLGIKFEWGPQPAGFMAPFDWDTNSIGIRGALEATGGISAFTLQALLMERDRTPVFDLGNQNHVSLMKYLPFAYHLDNAALVAYLAELAERRGVHHVDAQVGEVVLRAPDWIDHLRFKDGQEQRYDVYVDCTGFRSLLLGKALRTPYHSYADSLFTDSAVTGNVEHGGILKPYTTATTMEAGWCWNIPTRDSDHLGYVYSSGAISDDRAADEMAARFPGVTEPRFVRFRSGRHDHVWRGNVFAVGNSYGFVEPLESTGLLMITWAIRALTSTLPASWSHAHGGEIVNAALANRWDQLRWFLSIHYRFNNRLDTPFWKEVRERVDVSGAQPLLDVYAAGAPLRGRDALTRDFVGAIAPTFYGIAGVDTILLGQRVPTRLLPLAEPLDRWYQRRRAADVLVGQALPQNEALSAFESVDTLQDDLLHSPDSWAYHGRRDRL